MLIELIWLIEEQPCIYLYHLFQLYQLINCRFLSTNEVHSPIKLLSHVVYNY